MGLEMLYCIYKDKSVIAEWNSCERNGNECITSTAILINSFLKLKATLYSFITKCILNLYSTRSFPHKLLTLISNS